MTETFDPEVTKASLCFVDATLSELTHNHYSATLVKYGRVDPDRSYHFSPDVPVSKIIHFSTAVHGIEVVGHQPV